jgi:hypothetical protein
MLFFVSLFDLQHRKMQFSCFPERKKKGAWCFVFMRILNFIIGWYDSAICIINNFASITPFPLLPFSFHASISGKGHDFRKMFHANQSFKRLMIYVFIKTLFSSFLNF